MRYFSVVFNLELQLISLIHMSKFGMYGTNNISRCHYIVYSML